MCDIKFPSTFRSHSENRVLHTYFQKSLPSTTMDNFVDLTAPEIIDSSAANPINLCSSSSSDDSDHSDEVVAKKWGITG